MPFTNCNINHKLPSIRDRGQTDRVIIFANPWTVTLTFIPRRAMVTIHTYVAIKVRWFKRYGKNKRTDERTRNIEIWYGSYASNFFMFPASAGSAVGDYSGSYSLLIRTRFHVDKLTFSGQWMSSALSLARNRSSEAASKLSWKAADW